MAKTRKPSTSHRSDGFNTRWLKNALKSLGMGYAEALKEVTPNMYETAATAKDVTANVINTMRSNKTGQDRIRNTLASNKYVQAVQKAYKNAMSDIKSGNLAGSYDRAVDKMGGGDDSDSGFSFGEDSGGSDDSTKSSTGAAVLTLGEQMRRSTTAQLSMQKASMDATIAMNAASMQQTSAVGTEIINQLTNVNNNLSALVQYQNENMTKFIEASIGYYEKTGAIIDEKQKKRKLNASDVLTGESGLDLSQYKKLVKQQFKDLVNNSELGGVASMVTSDGFLDLLAENPLGAASQVYASYLIPKVMKASLTSMEAAYNNMVPTMLAEIAKLAEDESPTFAGKLKRMIGGTFGLKASARGDVKAPKVERGAIPFDGETKHAITEVITKELRDQTAYLKVIANHFDKNATSKANRNKQYWSYLSNDYVKGKRGVDLDITKAITDSITNAIEQSAFGSGVSMVRGDEKVKQGNLQAEMDKAITELYFEMSRQKHMNEDTLNTILNQLHTGDAVNKILRDHIDKMKKEMPDNYNNMVQGQRRASAALAKAHTDMDKDYRGYNIQNSSFKGVEESDKIDDLIHDIAFIKNNIHGNVGPRNGKITMDNGGEESVKGFVASVTKGMNSFVQGMISGKTGTEIVKDFSDVISEHTESMFEKAKLYLFGEKNERGFKEGGVLSEFSNSFKDAASKLKYTITGKGYTDSKGNTIADSEDSVMSELKKVGETVKAGVMEKLFGKVKNENGEWVKDENKEGIFGAAKDTFKQGFAGWASAFFGDEYDKDPEKFKENTKEMIKKAMPAGMAGGVLGLLGGSMMGSSILGMLVGGPIFGATMGFAGGFLSKSERFQNMLFGEKDEDGKRLGGIISKQTQDWFKENKNAIAGGAAIGGLKGAITGSGILGHIVGGPIAGAMMGVATSLVIKSGTFQEFLFGPEGKDGKRSGGLIGNITESFNAFAKNGRDKTDRKGLGMALTGMGAGGITAALIGKMGIMGAALTPAGPIGGALLGLAVSIKAQDKGFKKWLFGEKGGLKNLNGKKSDKQGVIGKIGNSINANIIRPMKSQAKFFFQDMGIALKHDILAPIAIAGQTVIESAQDLVKDIGSRAKNAAKNIGGFLSDFLIGKKGKDGREGGVLSPFVNAVTGFANAGITVVRNLAVKSISLPARLLRFGMSIISSKVTSFLATPVKLIKTGIESVTGLAAGVIKGAGHLLYKGIGGLFKVATAPFRWVGNMAKGLAKDIGHGIGRFARKRLGNKVDKIRDKWIESGRPGKAMERLRDRLEFGKEAKQKDVDEIKKERKNIKRHNANAKYIARWTDNEFSVDTQEARDYLKIKNYKKWAERFGPRAKGGDTEGEGYKPGGSTIDDDNKAANKAAKIAEQRSMEDIQKRNPKELTQEERMLQTVMDIRDNVKNIADGKDGSEPAWKQEEKKEEKNKEKERNKERLLNKFANKYGIEGRKEGESLDDYKARVKEAEKKFKNRKKGGTSDDESGESTNERQGSEFVREFLNGFTQARAFLFGGRSDKDNKLNPEIRENYGSVLTRAGQTIGESASDVWGGVKSFGRSWKNFFTPDKKENTPKFTDAEKKELANLRAEAKEYGIQDIGIDESLANFKRRVRKARDTYNSGGEGGRGARAIIYHRAVGGAGLLPAWVGNAARKVINTGGKALKVGAKATANVASAGTKALSKVAGGISSALGGVSNALGGDAGYAEDEEEGQSRGPLSGIRNRLFGSRSSSGNDIDGDRISDADEAEEKRQDEKRRADAARHRLDANRNTNRNAVGANSARAGLEISEAKRDKIEDSQERARANAKTAKDVKAEREESKFKQLQLKAASITAGATKIAAKGVSGISKLLLGGGLVAGIGALLNKFFPQATEAITDGVKDAVGNVNRTEKNADRQNGNSIEEETERQVKMINDGDLLAYNEDGSISNQTNSRFRYLARLGYDVLGKEKDVKFYNSKYFARRQALNKALKAPGKALGKTKLAKNRAAKKAEREWMIELAQGYLKDNDADFAVEQLMANGYSENEAKAAVRKANKINGKTKTIFKDSYNKAKMDEASKIAEKQEQKAAAKRLKDNAKANKKYEKRIKKENAWSQKKKDRVFNRRNKKKQAEILKTQKAEAKAKKTAAKLEKRAAKKEAIKTGLKNSKAGKFVEGMRSGLDGAKSKAKSAVLDNKVAKGAKKLTGEAGDLLKRVTGCIKEFFEGIGKKLGKKSPGILKALKPMQRKMVEGVGKHFGKIIAKVSAVFGGKLTLGGATLGISELIFIGGGALEGTAGAAKLFHVSKDDVDERMRAISAVIGGFAGSTVGSIIDIVVSLLDSVFGIEIYNVIATTIYEAWVGGRKSKKYKTLKASQTKNYNKYTEYKNKELEKALKVQKKMGVVPQDLTLEEFEDGIKEGIYEASYDSYETWNTKENGTALDMTLDAAGKAGKHIGVNAKKLFGTETTYSDKNGNTYKQGSDGKWYGYDKKGKELGEIPLSQIKKMDGIKKHKTKGKLKFVGDAAKATGAKIVDVAGAAGKKLASAGKAVWDSKAGKWVRKKTGEAGKWALEKGGKLLTGATKKLGKAGKAIAESDIGKKTVSAVKAVANSKVGKAVGGFAKGAGKAVVDVGGKVGGFAINTLGKALDKIPSAIKGIGSTLGKVGSVVGGVKNAVGGAVKGTLKTAGKAKDAVGGAVKKTAGKAKDVIGDVFGFAKNIFGKAKDTAGSLLGSAKEKGASLIGTLLGVGGKAKDFGGAVIDKVFGGAKNLAETGKQLLSGLFGGLTGVGKTIKGAAGKAKDTGASLAKSAMNFLSGGAKSIKVKAKGIAGDLASLSGTVLELMLSPVKSLIASGGALKDYIADGIKDIADPKKGGSVLDSAYKFLSGKAKGITVKKGQKQKNHPLGGIPDFVGNIFSALLSPVRMVAAATSSGMTGSTGGNHVQTLSSAATGGSRISNTIGAIGKGIGGFVSKIGGAVGGFFRHLGGSGEGGYGTDMSSPDGLYFSQNDPRWKNARYGNDGATMGDSGCGPAALAMAVNTDMARGGRGVNPMQMAGLAEATGNRDETGTNARFMSEAPAMMGMNSKQALAPSADYINSELDSGHPVVLLGKKGGYGGRGSAYTDSGHYVVATGRDSDGNIIIQDPRGKGYSGKFNADALAQETGSAWTIGGNGMGGRGSNNFTAADVIKIGLNEVGYEEKASAKNLNDKHANKGKSNHTKYEKDVFGTSGNYWCASFVSWCFYTAANKDKKKASKVIGVLSKSCNDIMNKLGTDKNPRPGDLIFFKGSRHSGANHIGIVTAVNGNTVKTVEGNTSSKQYNDNGGTVAEHSYNKNDSKILGFGHPHYDGSSNFAGVKSSGDSSTTSSGDASVSGPTSIFDKLSAGISGVITEAGNRILKGDTNTDFSGVFQNAANGISSSDSGSASSGNSGSASSGSAPTYDQYNGKAVSLKDLTPEKFVQTDITKVPKLSAAQVKKGLKEFVKNGRNHGSSMFTSGNISNYANGIAAAQDKTNISSLVPMAIGALESGWASSKIAKNKGNLWGWGAVNSNPYGGAKTFSNTDLGKSFGMYSSSLYDKYYKDYGAKSIYQIGSGSNPKHKGYAYSNGGKTIDKSWVTGVQSTGKRIINAIKGGSGVGFGGFGKKSDEDTKALKKEYKALKKKGKTGSLSTKDQKRYEELKKKFSKGKKSSTSSGTSWLAICAEIKKQMAAGKPGYYANNGGKTKKLTANGVTVTARTDCSGYVSACLACFTKNKKFNGLTSGAYNSGSVNGMISKYGFKKMSFPGWGDLKPGDIMARGGHVQIYAGPGTNCYNCGSSKSVNAPGPTTCSKKSYTCIYRLPDAGSVTDSAGDTSTSGDATVNSSSSGGVSAGESVFSKLSSGISNVLTEAQNRLLTGNTNTDFSGVFEGGSQDSSGDGGSSGDSGATGKATGSGNAEKVYNYFKSAGFSPAAAAGIMGNLYQESGLNPKSIQGNGKGPAAGIAQWENYNTKSARWKNLSNYAKKKGTDWTDLQTQLEFVEKELKGLGHYFGMSKSIEGHSVGKTSFNKFKQSSDVMDATYQFEKAFERAGKPNMSRRLSAAKKYLKQYGGKGDGTIIVNRNVDLGGFGKSSGAVAGVGVGVDKDAKVTKNKKLNSTNSKYYLQGITKKASMEAMLYKGLQILAHIAANTKEANNLSEDIKAYAKTTAKYNKQQIETLANVGGGTNRFNYYIVQDGRQHLQASNTTESPARADRIALDIARGGY